MTVDPNEIKQEELPIGDKPAEPATPALDVDAVAEAVIRKLKEESAAIVAEEEANRKPAPPPVRPVSKAETDSFAEIVARANDATHPLHHDAVIHLATLRRQGEDEEWAELGVGLEHPARVLYRSNPGEYAGRPKFAFAEWERQELKRSRDKDKTQAEPEKPTEEQQRKEAARRTRESAPGMPSRSVSAPSTGSGGRVRISHADFDRRVALEPDLDDKLDRGLIDFTD